MLEPTNAPAPVARAAAVAPDTRAQALLSFALGGEDYAIDSLHVQEIRSYDGVTRIANTPPYIKGVIDLRGSIVPIVDLRIKYCSGRIIYDEFTVLIIVNVGGRMAGLVVDGVADVVTLGADRIKAPPQFGPAMASDHILGMAALDTRMLIVIDIERLMLSPRFGLIEAGRTVAGAGH